MGRNDLGVDLAGLLPDLDQDVMEWSSLRSRVYLLLKEAIVSGRMLPGKVITLRSLAASLGTSAMPVREAVMRLVAEGAIELHANRTFATTRLSPSRFIELRDIRSEIEGFAAERAAAHISLEELADIKSLLRRTKQASLDPQGNYLALNREFHFAIYRASRLPELCAIIESLWMKYVPMLHYFSIDKTARANSDKFHRSAVAALGQRDGSAARAAIKSDIHDAADVILPRLTAEFESGGVRGERPISSSRHSH